MASGAFRPSASECTLTIKELTRPDPEPQSFRTFEFPELLDKLSRLADAVQGYAESLGKEDEPEVLIEELAKLRSVVASEGSKTREALQNIETGIVMMNDQMSTLLKGLQEDVEDEAAHG
jgi:hypothetical protein